MKTSRTIVALLLVQLAVAPLAVDVCQARTVLRNICRVKGQEENVIQGFGLVVGLAGTGEAGDPQTIRALATAMELMGSPILDPSATGEGAAKELSKIKNVAYVHVSATVPASGARSGDQLDCHVSAINGKSLAGGQLAFAALLGPNTRDRKIYALCNGPIHLEDPNTPTVGRIYDGCQMEADVYTPFKQDGFITLILDDNHAQFAIARDVADYLRSQFSRDESENLVHAISQSNIRIKIPKQYEDDVVAFVADVLEVPVYSPDPEARVVINQKTNDISISGDVTIGDIVVTHGSVVVEAGQTLNFESIQSGESDPARLQSLVQSLSALKVPPADIITLIKTIDRSGKLHGKLIIE